MADEDVSLDRDRHLLGQVREAFGRVAYSHKTNEKQADICFTKHRWQQAVLIGLTAVSSGTFLVAVIEPFASTTVSSFVTSTIAVLVTWVTLGSKSFKFHEEAEAHRDVAAQLWDVRESYVSLISDLMSADIGDAAARDRRDQLQEATHAIYLTAPRTTPRAYRKAKKSLKDNEELTFSSRELDLLLPKALRLNENGY